MGFIKSLRESISEIPVAIKNGSLYIKKATQAVFIDISSERLRLNPPSDWNESNTESPAYIQNKPQIGTIASYDVATVMDNSDSIPTNQLVSASLEALSNRLVAMGSQKEPCQYKAEMIDTHKVYIYTGNEQGMQNGYLYYFDDVSYDWVPGWLYNSEAITTDTSLTISGEAADSKVVGDKIGVINSNISSLTSQLSDSQEAIRDLSYNPIKVNSFTVTPSEVEIGSTINSIGCQYNFNVVPASASISIRSENYQYINAVNITQQNGTVNITNCPLVETSTVSLVGRDSGSDNNPVGSVTENFVVKFMYTVHYGISKTGELSDEFIINELTNHRLAEGNEGSFTIDAGNELQGFYIWYACPVEFGTPTFTVNSLAGGFMLFGTFNHTNTSGATNIPYQLWRSDNVGLGTTTVYLS